MSKVVVAIASDHAGVELKALVKGELEGLGFAVSDLGTQGHGTPWTIRTSPMRSRRRCAERTASQGVLICGTGIGISIAANRHRHVRAALCHDATSARLSRQHNDANVLALGARLIGPEVARDCVRMFFSTAFEGGRHRAPRRQAQLAAVKRQLRIGKEIRPMTQTATKSQVSGGFFTDAPVAQRSRICSGRSARSCTASRIRSS